MGRQRSRVQPSSPSPAMEGRGTPDFHLGMGVRAPEYATDAAQTLISSGRRIPPGGEEKPFDGKCARPVACLRKADRPEGHEPRVSYGLSPAYLACEANHTANGFARKAERVPWARANGTAMQKRADYNWKPISDESLPSHGSGNGYRRYGSQGREKRRVFLKDNASWITRSRPCRNGRCARGTDRPTDLTPYNAKRRSARAGKKPRLAGARDANRA